MISTGYALCERYGVGTHILEVNREKHMQDYTKLEIWKKSHRLVLMIYDISKDMPSDEEYGITCQMKRSAASVPANIAEGCGRGSNAELARYIRIAMGSASELDYHLYLAGDLGMIDEKRCKLIRDRLSEVRRMMFGFIGVLRNDNKTKKHQASKR